MAPTDRFVSENSFFVRYAETDAMAIVHHSTYIVYFEEARGYYSRVQGADYADFERSGYWLTVGEVFARYHYPTRYGQRLTTRCWISELKSRGLTFSYEIVDESGKVCVTGYSKHICINHQGQVAHIPTDWMQKFKQGLP